MNNVSSGLKNTAEVISGFLRRRWRKILKGIFLALQIFAIALVILGWYLDHGTQSERIIRIFAPKYSNALNLYDQMFESLGSEVDATIPGFPEMSLLLSEHLVDQFPDLGDFNIARIKVIGVTSMVVDTHPTQSGPLLTLLITLQDGRVLPNVEIMGDLRPQIQERFLEGPLFTWGERFQWLGIIITFAILIIEKIFELV